MPLACHDLSVSYGARRALTDLTLEIPEGEITTLIGPNGSGKSTALHALAGLIRPRAGRIELDGKPVERWHRRELAKRLSILPQAPSVPEEMTVEQLVRQGRFAHVGLLRGYRAEDHAAVRWALERTGLTELAQRGLCALSGGERQRAWIAAALAQEAGILLLDEPTTFLDIGHQLEVLELLRSLKETRGVTIVMAIHDLNQAMMVSDHIALLAGGRKRFDGTPQALADSRLIEQVFQVKGRYLPVSDGTAPHFRVELAGASAR